MTWQYIAGFFDGEGTIDCLLSPDKKRRTHFGVAVYQSQKQIQVLYDIQDFLKEQNIESHIYFRKEPRSNGEYKQNYIGGSLEIGHRVYALAFLLHTLPYLIVKKQQAIQAISKLIEYNDAHKTVIRSDGKPFSSHSIKMSIPVLKNYITPALGYFGPKTRTHLNNLIK